MISVKEFDLTGKWRTRDGRIGVVHRTAPEVSRNVAPYYIAFASGDTMYITIEGNGYDNHREYDLVDNLQERTAKKKVNEIRRWICFPQEPNRV